MVICSNQIVEDIGKTPPELEITPMCGWTQEGLHQGSGRKNIWEDVNKRRRETWENCVWGGVVWEYEKAWDMFKEKYIMCGKKNRDTVRPQQGIG